MMNSRYTPRWKRILAAICPFLFWRCPGGGLHWRWDSRICYHRTGERRDGWHGGILVDGREYVPLADRQAWHPVLVRLVDKYNDMVAMKIGREACPKVVSAEDVAYSIVDMEKAAQAARKFLGGIRPARDPAPGEEGFDWLHAIHCSNCGRNYHQTYNYCPRCGQQAAPVASKVAAGEQ